MINLQDLEFRWRFEIGNLDDIMTIYVFTLIDLEIGIVL